MFSWWRKEGDGLFKTVQKRVEGEKLLWSPVGSLVCDPHILQAGLWAGADWKWGKVGETEGFPCHPRSPGQCAGQLCNPEHQLPLGSSALVKATAPGAKIALVRGAAPASELSCSGCLNCPAPFSLLLWLEVCPSLLAVINETGKHFA